MVQKALVDVANLFDTERLEGQPLRLADQFRNGLDSLFSSRAAVFAKSMSSNAPVAAPVPNDIRIAAAVGA